MKTFNQVVEEFEPKFERATKTDLHYTGRINGKTYVVPHSFQGSGDVLHGTKTTPIRHSIVVSPVHVQHNNPTLTPEEVARVHAHIKDIHGGQEAPAKHDSFGKLDEDLKGEWNLDFSKNRRANMKRTLSRQSLSTNKGKGTKAWKRADKEDRASRPYTVTAGLQEAKANTAPESAYDKLFAARKAATLAFAKAHHITEGRPRPDKNWLNKLFPYDKKNPKGFKEPKKLEEAMKKQTEEVIKEHGYVGFDHKGQRHEVEAPSSYAAQQQIINKVKPPKSKQHLVHVALAELDTPEGRKQYVHTAMEESVKGDVPTHHQTVIAKKTLRMPDAMLGIMGGPSKEEARAHLKKQGWSDQQIHKHETAQFVSESVWHVTDHLGNKHEVEAKSESKAFQHAVSVGGLHPEGVPMTQWNKVKVEKKPLKEERLAKVLKSLHERQLSGAESEKKEEIVHGMKKKIQGFKERYGERAKEVMYATATARAKKLAESKDTDFENHPYHQKSDAELQSIVRDSATAVHALVGHKRSLKYADQHDAAASILEKRKKLTEGTHKFINAASSKKKLSESNKPYTTGDGKRFEKVEDATQHANAVHKKTGNIISVEHKPQKKAKLDFKKKLSESKYGYEPAMTSRLPAHLTDDPKGEKKLEQGHLQHCGKCGRVRVFEKGSMNCPVCKTEKVTEEVEQIDELSRDTMLSYVRGAVKNKDFLATKTKNLQARDEKSRKRTKGILRATERLEEAEQLNETFMGTYKRNESMNRHTANIVHLAKHFGTKADQAEAKFYSDELKKHGHQPHHEAAYKLHEKLWPLATAAHHYSEEFVSEERKPYDAYDFAVGAKLSHHVDDDTHFHMNKEHGVYHIKGFKQGKHFWDTAKTHGEAMKKFAAHKKGIAEELTPREQQSHTYREEAPATRVLKEFKDFMIEAHMKYAPPFTGPANEFPQGTSHANMFKHHRAQMLHHMTHPNQSDATKKAYSWHVGQMNKHFLKLSPDERAQSHGGMLEENIAKVKLSPAQKEALEAYKNAERQEDRYMGSVFVTPHGQRDKEEKTKAAYDKCKRLGMGVEHGL